VKQTLAPLIATCCGLGYAPWAPGTLGSLAALPLAWGLGAAFGVTGLLVGISLIVAAGWWAASQMERRTGIKDGGPIVIDEVAGQCLALAATPREIWGYVLGFVLFRFFDIVKPWPINWADRRIAGGLGVMADDLMAGAGAALLLAGARWFLER